MTGRKIGAPVRRTALSIGLAVALLLAGCGAFSPTQTSQPYVPADGLALTHGELQLENLVVVTEGEGEPGVLVGQALNGSAKALEVTFAFGEDGEPATVTLEPGAADGITRQPTNVDLGPVPAPPGALATLTVRTDAAGVGVVRVPVLPPDGGLDYYRDISP